MKKKYTLGGFDKLLRGFLREEKASQHYYCSTPGGRAQWIAVRQYAGHLIMQAGFLPKLGWRVTEFGVNHPDEYIVRATRKPLPKILQQLHARAGFGLMPALPDGAVVRYGGEECPIRVEQGI